MSGPTAPEKPKFDDPEMGVMRAYLQRAEVRLSTMHRIGGAFLSGAGLLFLLPIFAKDALVELAKAFTVVRPYVLAMPQADLWALAYTLPVLFAFGIPLYALWVLLRDLSLFYFSANIPSDSKRFHPRFALTAIPFADDEPEAIKQRLRELQFTTELRFFIIPQNEARRYWLTEQMKTDEWKVVALKESDWIPFREHRDFDEMRLAFGLAGAYDRDLVTEVAKSELSLIRHNLLLRRLVMRYMKALLALIWTALVCFGLLAAINTLPQNGRDPADVLFIITFTFLLWSALTPLIIRAPVRWIYEEYDQNTDDSTRDPDLVSFERLVTRICIAATLIGSLALYPLIGHFFVYSLLLSIPGLFVLARSKGRFSKGFLRRL